MTEPAPAPDKAEDEKAKAPAAKATKTKATAAPRAPRKAKEPKEPVIKPGELGSKVMVNTRNPINGSLQNPGIIIKIGATVGDRRPFAVARIELATGGFHDVVCRTEPGVDLDPYWTPPVA